MNTVIVKFLGTVSVIVHAGVEYMADAKTLLAEIPVEVAKVFAALNAVEIFASDMKEAQDKLKADAVAAVEAAKVATAKLTK